MTTGVRSLPMNTGTVLVVDDDSHNRHMFSVLLQRSGYTVHVARDGEEGLALLDVHGADIVLLDVQMPGIDGFEVCRRIKADPRTRLTPVVLVTGLDARTHRIEGIVAGADDFLSKPFDAEELQARVRSLIRVKRYTDQLDSAEAIILSLARTIEARDSYTQGHCERLALYSTALGRALALSPDELAALYRGAFLHDIGKVGIPDAVLLKPGRLTPEEYDVMKQHTVIGDELCGSLASLQPVRPIVRHHHERLDGTGYPDGLVGDQISVLTQIVSLVDMYDAITTTRPYQAARPAEEAFAELAREVSQGWRNAEIVSTFVDLVKRGGIGREGSPLT